MQYHIQKLTREQIIETYNQWINEHFPEDEVKPLGIILDMWDKGLYFGLGLFDGDENQTGYGFFAKAPESRLVLLDYLAIREEYRSKGAGSAFLAEMKEFLRDYDGILIETEDIACAKSEEEKQERTRRNAFYKKAGAVMSGARTAAFGVPYTLWCYPCAGSDIGDENLKAALRNIYRSMLLEDVYEKYIQI